MLLRKTIRLVVLTVSPFAFLALPASPADAQVKDVVVGITMTCPYENAIEGGCWSGAYWSLMQLDGIKSVEKSANGYNCTAKVFLKEGSFPDPEKWTSQFKELVDQTYLFRGVEITASGTVTGDVPLVLTVPGVEQPITLKPLEHKLQWNSKKKSARQPEPDERDAYQQLAARRKEDQAVELRMDVTGPLLKTAQGLVLEVREFSPSTPK